MKNLQNKIKSLAENYFKDTVEIRRHLHAYPELSFKEYKTSEYIQQKLTAYSIPFTSGLAETGVLGIIKGKNPNSKCPRYLLGKKRPTNVCGTLYVLYTFAMLF